MKKNIVFCVFLPSLFNHFNQFVFYFCMVSYVEETNDQLNSMHVSFSSSLKILGWNQKHAQSKNLFISIENIVIIPFFFFFHLISTMSHICCWFFVLYTIPYAWNVFIFSWFFSKLLLSEKWRKKVQENCCIQMTYI